MKKSKKFVLAALALLAITGLLALSGCKNDTVPPEVEKQEQGDGGGSETDKNNTAAKLVSITVTPPTKTVYSVGDEVVHKKGDEIGVIATYDDWKTSPVTGTITTDTSTLTQSAGVQTVTVRYSEGGIVVSGQFKIRVLPKKLINYTSPNNTDDSWTYVEFGEWPQNEAPGVDPTFVDPQPENLFKGKYYSDANGKYVKVGDKYYKVEPIVWRVLNKDYASTGKALLLAEKILTGGIKWADSSNNYMQSNIRQWLNGNSGTEETSDYGGDAGFLQTAFTESAQKLIAPTTVDNSAASTIPSGITDEDLESYWNSGENQYASDTLTMDKIFLLSEEEATNSEYGFDEYNRYVGDDYNTTTSTRIRVTTDYAEATGVYQGDSSAGYGGRWWLRSPNYFSESFARGIDSYGDAYNNDLVYNADGGVVPALSISLGGN